MLYARWRIMGTGPPAFTDVDNPASFAENIFLRVSMIEWHTPKPHTAASFEFTHETVETCRDLCSTELILIV